MDLERWNPWQELERVEREVERLLSSIYEKLGSAAAGRPIAFVPRVDVVETPSDYHISLSLPGVIEEDIDISIDGNVLTVRGERESPAEKRGGSVRVRQWRYGYFERRIELPDDIDASSLEAMLENGVLTIRLARLRHGDEGR